MPLRTPSPDFAQLRDEMLKIDTDRFIYLMSASEVDDSRYLHWSELSRRTPPAQMTTREWWFAVKSRRIARLRTLSIADEHGQPFRVNLTDEVLQLSEEIARRAGGSIQSAEKDDLNRTNTDTYLVRSLLEESIRSSQLEGASTTRRVAVEMIDSGRKPQDISETMIYNNYLAMQLAKSAHSEPMSEAFVLDLHRTLVTGTGADNDRDAGRMQTQDDERVSVWANDICVHIPPPATLLPERLSAVVAFANGTSQDSPYLPPVVRAIITHFMFGYDHYFADGNGRTARAAFYWSMLHNGYWLAEFATISGILRNAPGKYGDAYQFVEDDDGDLTYFVLHQLRVFIRALDDLDAYIEARRTETSQVLRALSSVGRQLNYRQREIVESLSREEYTTLSARSVKNRFHVTEQSGRNDLRELEQLGLLARLPKSRPAIWVAAGDLAAQLAGLQSK